MVETVTMKKGGQVRQVLKSKVGKMVDKGFVQVEADKDGLLVEKGGKEDLAKQVKNLKTQVTKLTNANKKLTEQLEALQPK